AHAWAQKGPSPRPVGGKGVVPSSGVHEEEPAAPPKPGKPPKPNGAKGASAAEELPGEGSFNQCRKLPPGKRVKVTLKPESELNALIGWISTMTCKKFIIPQNIRSQKVTIISPVPVTPEEGYRLFLSALNSIGLTVAPAGDALQIVETPRVKEDAPVYSPDEIAPSDDRYITRLIRLQNVPAAEIGGVLQKLRSKDGDVSWYDPTGTLIITDTASNVKRMMEVIHSLDMAGSGEKIWIVKLHNTTAADMAQKLGEVFQVAGGAGKPSGIPPAGGRPPGRGIGAGGGNPAGGEGRKNTPARPTHPLLLPASRHRDSRLH